MFETPSSSPEATHEMKMFYTIPDREIDCSFARSGGPGGQNVNKKSTKAQVRWHILGSTSFTDEQKVVLERELRNWINEEGCVSISNQETRSQEQNKQKAVDRLNELVNEALVPKKERVPTRPTRSSNERRLADKNLASRKKDERSNKDWD